MGRWLCVDPGEETGWSLFTDEGLLLGGGQTKLWPFAHDVWDALKNDQGPLGQGQEGCLRGGVTGEQNVGQIELVICEKFALYPWAASKLSFDEFRTVQLIGAITFMCDLFDIELVKQPASIKERAIAGGAKELFVRPLHENRHQNDSQMHGFYYQQVTVNKVNLGTEQ